MKLARKLLLPASTGPRAAALLCVAAVGVLVAGLMHARLFHRGYGEVEIVGPLFLLHAIGSTFVLLALPARRVWLFVLGTVSICLPSLVSIALSHSSVGFLGFREGGYDADALVIVSAEIVAVVFAVAGGFAAAGSAAGGRGSAAARGALGVLLVGAMGWAIAGVGMGASPAERQRAPTAAAIDAARDRIATGTQSVRRGRELFADQGCDRCHSIAAIDAGGKLGPRLDTLDEDLDDNIESIADPREDTADGYPRRLMPADFDERLGDADLRALAAFVTTVSGEQDDEREDDDGRRGRGRGRSGSG